MYLGGLNVKGFDRPWGLHYNLVVFHLLFHWKKWLTKYKWKRQRDASFTKNKETLYICKYSLIDSFKTAFSVSTYDVSESNLTFNMDTDTGRGAFSKVFCIRYSAILLCEIWVFLCNLQTLWGIIIPCPCLHCIICQKYQRQTTAIHSLTHIQRYLSYSAM